MNTESAASGPHSFYEAVGGEDFFDRLVTASTSWSRRTPSSVRSIRRRT